MLSSRAAAGTYGMQVNTVYYKAVACAASSIRERECKCDALNVCCNVDVRFRICDRQSSVSLADLYTSRQFSNKYKSTRLLLYNVSLQIIFLLVYYSSVLFLGVSFFTFKNDNLRKPWFNCIYSMNKIKIVIKCVVATELVIIILKITLRPLI